MAREKGARTVGLTGKSGGLIAREADFGFVVPSQTTARILNALGMKMDAEVWTALHAEIVKEIQRRKDGSS